MAVESISAKVWDWARIKLATPVSALRYASVARHVTDYAFKGQVHVFAGRVKIVSHLSSRTSAILKYFCPLVSNGYA